MKKLSIFLLFIFFFSGDLFAAFKFNEKAVLLKKEKFMNKIEISDYFEEAYAYGVIPRVITAGVFGLTGTGGKGMVFVGDKIDGCIRVRGAALGLAAGGQSYSEIIFFQDKETYERLKKGKLEWSGTAEFGGQVGDKGVRPQAEFRDGMYVDTIVNKGLMFEVTLGTQRLKYKERNKDGSCF